MFVPHFQSPHLSTQLGAEVVSCLSHRPRIQHSVSPGVPQHPPGSALISLSLGYDEIGSFFSSACRFPFSQQTHAVVSESCNPVLPASVGTGTPFHVARGLTYFLSFLSKVGIKQKPSEGMWRGVVCPGSRCRQTTGTSIYFTGAVLPRLRLSSQSQKM